MTTELVPPREALRDFAIVCYQRSGSHFLQSCLASHSDIGCHGEVLEPPRDVPLEDGRLRGGILMYNAWERAVQHSVDPKLFLHLLRDPWDTALSVERNVLSKQLRGPLHKSHYRRGDPLPPVYEPDQDRVEERAAEIRRYQADFRDRLPPDRTLVLAYAELTGNSHQDRLSPRDADRICTFLGVEVQPLHTTLVKTGPAS